MNSHEFSFFVFACALINHLLIQPKSTWDPHTWKRTPQGNFRPFIGRGLSNFSTSHVIAVGNKEISSMCCLSWTSSTWNNDLCIWMVVVSAAGTHVAELKEVDAALSAAEHHMRVIKTFLKRESESLVKAKVCPWCLAILLLKTINLNLELCGLPLSRGFCSNVTSICNVAEF